LDKIVSCLYYTTLFQLCQDYKQALTDVKRQLDEAKQEAHHWYQELTYLGSAYKVEAGHTY